MKRNADTITGNSQLDVASLHGKCVCGAAWLHRISLQLNLMEPSPPMVDPAIFPHIRIVLSMVVSLGIARLLSGVARFVQHPGRKRAYGVHLLWVLSLLLSMMHFWWWEFSLSHLQVWRFETYVFVVGYAALYYFLCAVLFPDDLAEYTGYRDYFMSRRRWFFALLATTYLVDVADTWIKGQEHLTAQGYEYAVRTASYVVLCAVASLTTNARFHVAFAMVSLTYQISWILRVYDVIGK
ncbi:hypothetical protein ACSFA7_32495 [Variovorax sp. LT1R20]|uniref:hypothetical protein n=1 Tax=Variovorax sp. LT1R20 TaxID=3443729 RepID=UPI003F48C84C